MNSIQQYYHSIIRQNFLEKFNCQNSKDIGKFQNLIISGTIKKKFSKQKLNIFSTIYAMELISGKKPVLTKSKKSISGFQLKQDTLLGFKNTLRQKLMYFFLYRFSTAALPRYREFQGFDLKSSKQFKYYSLGLNNIWMFAEIDSQYDLFRSPIGFNLLFNSNIKNKSEILFLLRHFQIPANQN